MHPWSSAGACGNPTWSSCSRLLPTKSVGGRHLACIGAQFNAKPQPTMRAEQCDQGRPERHQPAAAEARLVGLAVLEQFGVQAQTRVDQKDEFVDLTHLYRHRRTTQQGHRGLCHAGRNTMRPGEVVEGAQWQHPHGAPLRMRGLGHRIDRSVAPHRHQRGPARTGRRPRLVRDARKFVRSREQQFTGSASLRQRGFDRLARGLGVVVTRRRVDDEKQRRGRIDFGHARRRRWFRGRGSGGLGQRAGGHCQPGDRAWARWQRLRPSAQRRLDRAPSAKTRRQHTAAHGVRLDRNDRTVRRRSITPGSIGHNPARGQRDQRQDRSYAAPRRTPTSRRFRSGSGWTGRMRRATTAASRRPGPRAGFPALAGTSR